MRDRAYGRVETPFHYSPPQDRSFRGYDLQVDIFPLQQLDVRCICRHLNSLDMEFLRSVAKVLVVGAGQGQAEDPQSG
jgi:hypothetical protein